MVLGWRPRLFERHGPLAAGGEAEPEAAETVQRIDPVDADFKTRLRALPQHGHRMRDDRRAHTVPSNLPLAGIGPRDEHDRNARAAGERPFEGKDIVTIARRRGGEPREIGNSETRGSPSPGSGR